MGWWRLLLLLLLLSFDFLAELLLLADVDEADEAIKALELWKKNNNWLIEFDKHSYINNYIQLKLIRFHNKAVFR